jgi:hypothetical protein
MGSEESDGGVCAFTVPLSTDAFRRVRCEFFNINGVAGDY